MPPEKDRATRENPVALQKLSSEFSNANPDQLQRLFVSRRFPALSLATAAVVAHHAFGGAA